MLHVNYYNLFIKADLFIFVFFHSLIDVLKDSLKKDLLINVKNILILIG
jgi:hypothetical protein